MASPKWRSPHHVTRINNMNNKIPSMVVWGDLINIKFADYKKEYRSNNIEGIPCNYLFNIWLNCVKWRGCKKDFWRFILEHYKYHIYGHYKYHEIKENRASLKITRFLKKH